MQHKRSSDLTSGPCHDQQMTCFAVACIFLSQTNLYLISVYAEKVPCVFQRV